MDHSTKPLKPYLDRLLEESNTEEHLSNDPLSLVHLYDRPEDQEIAAFLISSLSYGRDPKIREAASEVLDALGTRPYRFLVTIPRSRIRQLLLPFHYRMTSRQDILDLVTAVRAVIRDYGSLQDAYLSCDSGDHFDRASHLISILRSNRYRPSEERGFKYLIPDPADGSACKRLHMFFRWVVRGPDGVDIGIWDEVDSSELRMPLDTHTSRICRDIGLTDRKSVDHKTVEEVTDALRSFDPEDPVKYDFAIAHLGMSDSCIHERSEDHCPTCPLDPICTLE